MISEVWKTLLDYLKHTPQWPWLEPVLLAGFLYTGVIVATYQYVQWRYGVTLPLPRFLGSYVFRQVSIAFGSVLTCYVLLVAPLPPAATARRWTVRLLGRHAGFILRLAGIALVATVGTLTARAISPHTDVGSIRVMIAPSGAFAAPAGGDTPAEARPANSLDMSKHRDLLIYLLFELNRLQQTWHFVADFTPFRREMMPAGSEVCNREPSPLICYAGRYQAASRGDGEPLLPLVVIAGDPLSPPRVGLKFWVHSGATSVISTADWAGETMPGVLDYLVYTLTLQAIVTHLDLHCPGHGLTAESDSDLARQRTDAQAQEVVSGNVFEFAPRREALRGAILAGRLGPEDELRLLNCFGPDYMRTAGMLLGLDWLHAPRVRENLEKAYGVRDGIVAQPAP
jgi:hypothetical protein